MPVHPTAAAGYSLAGDDYERARPEYPAPLLDALITGLGLGSSSLVVELGAGTGKFTRMLDDRIGLVVATEPVASMRAHLVTVCSTVVAALAEAVPIADHSVDAVVAATAFHWFDAVAAQAEARRILRPGGGLGLVWNNPDREVEWIARVWAVVDEARGPVPGNRDLSWRRSFDTGTQFGPLSHLRFSHSMTLRRDDLVARIASISFVAALSDGQRRGLLERVRAIMQEHPDVSDGEGIVLPYVSDLYMCHARR